MPILGVSNQIRNGIINGMEACIITHHINVIFRYLALNLPKKIFIINETADTITTFINVKDLVMVARILERNRWVLLCNQSLSHKNK